MRRFKFKCLALIIISLLAFSAACVRGPAEKDGTGRSRSGPVRIGLSLDTLKEERWQRDRDLFVQRAKELGADVLVQAANGDDHVQMQQAENLLTQGVDVLVVVPHNGEVTGAIVDSAKGQKVPVIAYDRLIRNSEPELYVSFDNEKVGELQAKYLLDRAPKGNYVLIGGAPANNNVVAIVASNDATAGGCIRALEGQRLAGKVLVSGQDADLAGLQRIVAGTQSMTVYKPVAQLAR